MADLGPGNWFDISLDLTPLRMPTFFLVSGILAQNAIDNDWPKARRRSMNLYFVYLLWTTLISLRLFLPAARGDGPAPTLAVLGANAIVPAYYWYIWALPAYYLVSVGVRRLLGRAAPWVLVPAAALSFFAHDLNTVFTPYYPRVLEIMWTTERAFPALPVSPEAQSGSEKGSAGIVFHRRRQRPRQRAGQLETLTDSVGGSSLRR